MTRDQVIDIILRRCRRTGPNADDLIPVIQDELDLAQQTVCEQGLLKPWFLLDITEVTIDSTGWKAPLPEDLIELYENTPAILYIDAGTGAARPLERAGRADVAWGLQSPNTLSAYELNESYILLATQLTAGNRLRMLYYKKEPLPIGDYGDAQQSAPNRWYVYASDVMIGEVGYIIATSYLRNKEMEDTFILMRERAWQRLNAATISREEATRDRFLGGALYPLPNPLPPPAIGSGNVSDPVGFTTRTYNTSVVKGDTWFRRITYTVDGEPVDLTSYTAELEVKLTFGGATLLSITQASGIVLGADGTIELTLSAAQTSTLAAGNYVYDLQLTTGSDVATIMRGVLTVEPEVTT